MKLFIYLTYLYLTVYTIYFALLAFKGTKKPKKIRDDYGKKYNNLCVVVYSHNNKKTIENLIKQLKNQVYPKNNYTIQLILDNCNDQSEILFQGDLDVNVMEIKNVDTIGKNQALSIVIEKYSSIKDLDAYVFLDGQNYVNSDFLEKINDSLQNDDVITGSTTLICNEELNLLDNIKYSYNLYKNNFLSKARHNLGLSNLVNSDVVAIKKYVLDEIGTISINNPEEELNFTMQLAQMDVKCGFCQDAKIYVGIKNCDFKIPALSKRIGLFLSNITKIRHDNKNFSELVASLIYPNCLTLFILYYLVFNYAYNVKSLLNGYIVGAGIENFVVRNSANDYVVFRGVMPQTTLNDEVEPFR